MNEQEQRIAIAEACGYKHMPHAKGLMWLEKEGRAVITPGSDVEKARLRMKLSYEPGKYALPDYLHDLNAMHEAEAWLGKHDKHLFIAYGDRLHQRLLWAVFHATAAQRAEAFLRTIGKWVNDDTGPEPTYNNERV